MNATVLPSNLMKQELKNNMPWLWELQDDALWHSEETVSRILHIMPEIFKEQYEEGTTDYIPELVNSRRLWGVCDHIRAYYAGGKEWEMLIESNKFVW